LKKNDVHLLIELSVTAAGACGTIAKSTNTSNNNNKQSTEFTIPQVDNTAIVIQQQGNQC